MSEHVSVSSTGPSPGAASLWHSFVGSLGPYSEGLKHRGAHLWSFMGTLLVHGLVYVPLLGLCRSPGLSTIS